ELHTKTVFSLKLLASMYVQQKQYADSIKWMIEFINASEKIDGENNDEVTKVRCDLAMSYRNNGQTDQAVEQYEIVRDYHREIGDTNSVRYIRAIIELICTHEESGMHR